MKCSFFLRGIVGRSWNILRLNTRLFDGAEAGDVELGCWQRGGAIGAVSALSAGWRFWLRLNGRVYALSAPRWAAAGSGASA